jgi:hypothetical protein
MGGNEAAFPATVNHAARMIDHPILNRSHLAKANL